MRFSGLTGFQLNKKKGPRAGRVPDAADKVGQVAGYKVSADLRPSKKNGHSAEVRRSPIKSKKIDTQKDVTIIRASSFCATERPTCTLMPCRSPAEAGPR